MICLALTSTLKICKVHHRKHQHKARIPQHKAQNYQRLIQYKYLLNYTFSVKMKVMTMMHQHFLVDCLSTKQLNQDKITISIPQCIISQLLHQPWDHQPEDHQSIIRKCLLCPSMACYSPMIKRLVKKKGLNS